MATASDLIKSSLRAIGAIASGETPSASEQSDALDVLNDILEEWSNDGFMIFEKKVEEFTFTPDTASYSIATGATFNSARPQVILEARVKKAGEQYEYPLKVLSHQEWARIAQKTLSADLPTSVYYNRTYPSGTLYFWPVPDAANTLVLHSLKPLTAIASAATTLSYPPGYKKALKYVLASELAPEFGRPLDPKVEQIARDSKAAIARSNTDEVLLTSDAFGLVGPHYFDGSIGE